VYLLFLSKVHLGGEGTPLRGEVKKLTVTSHQLCEKFKYIPGQFGVDFLWISVDFGENGVDFGENGQVLTPTDETFEWGVGGSSVDLSHGLCLNPAFSQPRAWIVNVTARHKV
jgi:hypothetical protein